MSPSRRSSSTDASTAAVRACSSIAGEVSTPITRRPVAPATGIATRPFPTASSTSGPLRRAQARRRTAHRRSCGPTTRRSAPTAARPSSSADATRVRGARATSRPHRGRPVRRYAGCGRRAPASPSAPCRAGGIPKRSFTPWTTSVGTATASSSGSRLGAGAPPARRGGSSGKARQTTPIAPVAAAVRHATRAPEDRPPVTSGRPAGSETS